MNDIELLELAAKAAGYTPHISQSAMPGLLLIDQVFWSPLEDDGDAMRLAIQLHIDIQFFEGFEEVIAEHASGQYRQASEKFSDDMASATRRAIVRAAAEIAQQNPA